MKKLLFILLMAIPLMGVAQENNSSKEELATVQVIDKVFDRTTEAIQQLADALKVPAEHVYTVLVKQQFINSISILLGEILLLIIGACLVYIPYKHWLNVNAQYNIENNDPPSYRHWNIDEGAWLFFIIPGALITLIAVIWFCCDLPKVFTGFINPEYGAIKDIVHVL